MVMLEDRTFEIKTYDHNDAVIYVTSHSYVIRDDKAVHSTEVIAVVPINIMDSYATEFTEKVSKACDALAELYQYWPDGEVKIQYVINAHPYVNV
jgi:hypothetical protein